MYNTFCFRSHSLYWYCLWIHCSFWDLLYSFRSCIHCLFIFFFTAWWSLL